jgi:hypothetical protein
MLDVSEKRSVFSMCRSSHSNEKIDANKIPRRCMLVL